MDPCIGKTVLFEARSVSTPLRFSFAVQRKAAIPSASPHTVQKYPQLQTGTVLALLGPCATEQQSLK